MVRSPVRVASRHVDVRDRLADNGDCREESSSLGANGGATAYGKRMELV